MNTAKICVFGLALFCLCGCTDSHYEMKQVPPQLSQAEMSRTDIVKVGYELADGLIKKRGATSTNPLPAAAAHAQFFLRIPLLLTYAAACASPL